MTRGTMRSDVGKGNTDTSSSTTSGASFSFARCFSHFFPYLSPLLLLLLLLPLLLLLLLLLLSFLLLVIVCHRVLLSTHQVPSFDLPPLLVSLNGRETFVRLLRCPRVVPVPVISPCYRSCSLLSFRSSPRRVYTSRSSIPTERRGKKPAVFLVSPVILVRMVGKRVFRGRDTLKRAPSFNQCFKTKRLAYIYIYIYYIYIDKLLKVYIYICE